MDKVVIFADHTIGYWLTEYLLQNQKNYFIADVYTNETANAWWDDLRQLQNYYPIKIKLFNPDTTYLEIEKTNPDYLLLLSWKHLIKKNILENVKVCTVNLHYSLLPKHRGVYPVNWAIYSGDTETGITFHIVDEKVDNGPIVGQLTEKISVFDDAFSLIQKLDHLALKLFKKIWDSRSDWKTVSQQNEKISYHSKSDFIKSCKIDLNQSGTFLEFINIIRSKKFNNDTSAYFYDDNGQKIKVNITLSKDDSV